MKPTTVTTGRTDTRRLCLSCEARVKYGDPRNSEAWVARLQLNPEQVDLILLAAREYDLLCEEAGERSTAVEFTDWIRPDALSPKAAA